MNRKLTSKTQQPMVSAEMPGPFTAAGSELCCGLSRLPSLIAVLVFAVGLLFPLVYVVAHGWTLAGLYEESIGYRYFYSLRLVYGEGEYVFLPQGQLAGVVHQAIQVVLTRFGYPSDVLFPRIDVFAYAAVALAHLVAIAAFGWAIGPLRTVVGKVNAALFWLLLYYLPSVSLLRGFLDQGAAEALPPVLIILQPDYHTWVISVGLLTAGALVRWSSMLSPWRLRDSVALGLFTGLVAGIKLTLLIFPAALALAWLIWRRPVYRSVGMGLAAVPIAQLASLVVLLTYYRGNVAHVGTFLNDLGRFLSGVDETKQLYVNWFWTAMTHRPWGVGATVALPFLLLGAIPFFWGKPVIKTIMALFPGALAYHWLLYNRFVPATWIEATVFLQMTIYVVAVVGPRKLSHLPWKGIGAAGLALVLGFFFQSVRSHLGEIAMNDEANRKLWHLLDATPGRIAFLIPDNRFRLLSVDSAISKGGSDVFEGEYSSPLVRRMFPEREYFLQLKHYYHRLTNLDEFSTIVFTIPRGMGLDKQGQMTRLAELYAVPFFLFRCDREMDFVYQMVVMCVRSLTMTGYLSSALGVRVDAAAGEVNQYLIRAPRGSVDLTKVGKIHADLGYAVGVTLPNGTQIGFRYEPPGSKQAR